MLIEYKIKFEKNGLVITEKFDDDVSSSTQLPHDVAAQNSLKSSYAASVTANTSAKKAAMAKLAGGVGGSSSDTPGGPGGDGGDSSSGQPGGPGGNPSGPGGGSSSGRPITIIGPIIFGCPVKDAD